ncbi:hypothetical protein [Apilactobacillus xinyiensis]|uniref:hypothetical protein n=1 Tax=Apilactobacillus xinyiensis TaxID=2841032 RepID=UPI00200CDC54|nr:hypothetical protein [Apilactobacillus xinyiensis]MCL0330685.1 hypothetical protein [Apilactobacillus xinyiensis]
MFDEMVKNNYQYATQSDIDNYYNVGLITKECHDYVTQIKQQNTDNQTTEQGEQPQQ